MRDLGQILFYGLFFICIAIVYNAYAATNGEFIEGKHYQRAPADVAANELVQELMSQANGNVQVLEFFSYGCSWCFKLDPYLEKWRKTMPANVDFQRIPVEFHPTWGTLTKAYYTEVNLKATDKIHTALFDAIQTERIGNSSEDTLRQFFATQGIPAQDFTTAFNSFDVTRKQKWANTIARAYRITSVPAVIVQGPKGIFITAVRLAGSEDNVISVLNDLVKIQSQAATISPKNDENASTLKQPVKNTQ